MAQRKIHLITTGGTIEKRYIEQMGAMVNSEPQIRRCLSLLRLGDTAITVQELMNKDSLLMTDEDRAMIVAAVSASLKPDMPVVITHGTDTMVQSGLAIDTGISIPAAPVILTGAMTPFGIEGSDALQNLTESLLASSLLAPGVYIVFHGEVFPIHDVKKDVERSRFVRSSNA
ncbi:MAG: asparaginase [Acidobacteria bacterium]|nr:asparaginase [Acidobacteriota bacterium]